MKRKEKDKKSTRRSKEWKSMKKGKKLRNEFLRFLCATRDKKWEIMERNNAATNKTCLDLEVKRNMSYQIPLYDTFIHPNLVADYLKLIIRSNYCIRLVSIFFSQVCVLFCFYC